MTELLNKMIKYYEFQGLSDNTISSYQNNLKSFFTFLDLEENKQFSTDLVERYKTFLIENGYFTNSINAKLTALSAYIKFLRKKEKYDIPKLSIKKIEQPEKDTFEHLLTVDEYKKLIKTCENNNDYRAKALFSFMRHTGCRVGETVKVPLVAMDQAQVLIQFKRRTRNITINKTLKAILKKYVVENVEKLEEIRASDKYKFIDLRYSFARENNSLMMFTGKQGNITTKRVEQLLKYYGSLAGIDDKKLTCHKLRHLFAVEFLKKNKGDVNSLRVALGHKDLATTQIYLKITEEELAAKF